MSLANVGWHVGFFVGFWTLPDMNRFSQINRLRLICRECRVCTGVESSIEREEFHHLAKIQANPLVPLDLNDAPNRR